MREIISLFILNVLHPFQIQSELGKQKASNTGHLSLVTGSYENKTYDPTSERWSLSFVEFLSVSWIFIIIHALYELISLNWGIFMSEQLFDGKMSDFFMTSVVRFSRVHSLMGTLIEVVLFPLSLWIYAKFWEMIITFFAQLFKVEESQDRIRQVIHQSFACHIMLIIPIIGPLVRHIAGLVYIYAGLRENLGMTKMQATLVVVSPLILFLLMGLIFFVSFTIFLMNLFYL
ncbi:MAG: hypothetical protein Fur0010_25170 [Bdellovibrio sp.]